MVPAGPTIPAPPAPAPAPLDLALLALSTVRVVRAVTTDDIGEWLVRQPAYHWANNGNPVVIDPPADWRAKLISGLDCPWCVGFWVAAGNVIAYAVLPRPLWRTLAAPFALNYVAVRLDNLLERLEDF